MRAIMRLASRIILSVAILCALSIPAHAVTRVTLSWTPPSETEFLAGYRVRWSASSDAANATVIDVGGPATLSTAVVEGLPDVVKVWLWVQVYDVLGQDSEWGGPAIKPGIPATIGGLKVIEVKLVR